MINANRVKASSHFFIEISLVGIDRQNTVIIQMIRRGV